MHTFLLKFSLVLNSVLLFWKFLVFEFPLGTSETLVCSISAPHVKLSSARCAAANAVGRDVDVFGAGNVPINHIL
jgi:hypothetical protein